MLNLRPAAPDDAATMATVHIDAWRTAYRGLVPGSFLAALDHGQRKERFRGFLETGARDAYIIEHEAAAIGPCRDDDLDAQSTGEIWGIYLAPAHWRQGIGTQVCREAEQMLRDRGFGRIVLWVFEGSNSARRFYEAMGYAPDGESRVIQTGAPLPAVRYRKDLPSQARASENDNA
jgi:RimJ/RimL family protein N-acetyltransferase